MTRLIPFLKNLLWAEGAFFCLGTPQVAYQLWQRSPSYHSTAPHFLFLQSLFYYILGYLFVAGLASLAAAYGLEQDRPWSTFALRVAAFLNVLIVPLGTVFGVLALWVTFNADAAEI